MSAAVELAVTGMGAVTPVGLSVPSSCAALRAGIARMGELETYRVDSDLLDKIPVVGGRVPTEWFHGGPVAEEWPGHERFQMEEPPPPEKLVAPDGRRLLELAAPAAREAWGQAGLGGHRPGGLGLYLGLDDHDEPAPVLQAVQEAIGMAPEHADVHAAGRSAGLMALAAAAKDLAEGRVQVALVGGVDSLVRGPVVRRLDAAGLVRSASRPQGLIPGEAAAFLVLETMPGAANRRAGILTRLLATASAAEPTAGTEEPNQGKGLTEAVRAVRDAGGGLEEPPLVVCDLNGDRYRAMEWTMASLRTLGSIHGDMEVWHPADCIGDTGAASGIVNVLWAATAFGRGYAPAGRALVWGASEGPARAAALLAPASEEG